MKTKNKTHFAKLILASLALPAMMWTSIAHAGYYNLGTLDVAPVIEDGAVANEWFVEYLKPGESRQEKIRISNFGTDTLTLGVYTADTSKNHESEFFAKNPGQLSDDMAGWIRLPSETITLKGGQSKIISANFIIPENAGVGLHTGAVIVRNLNVEQDNIVYEKGIRVYLNVTGPVVTSFGNTNFSLSQKAGAMTAGITTANTGTTDIVTDFDLELKDVFGTTVETVHSEKRVKPGTEGITTLALEKPQFGYYTLNLISGSEKTQVAGFVIIPIWAVLLFLAIVLLVVRPSFIRVSASDMTRIFSSANFRKSFAYVGVLLVTVTSTAYFAELMPIPASADSQTASPSHSYYLTVKWGDLRGITIPKSYVKKWQGKLSFQNATIGIDQYLHFERTDRAELADNSTAINYSNITGPDNDGIIIKVTPTGAEIPQLTYQNSLTGETYTFPVTKCVTAPAIYPDSIFAAYFKAELAPVHALMHLASEMEATPELLATPPPVANIPELENLFLEELPATPEALADLILTSDYVQETSTENAITTLETDEILIDALEATPEILAEITATPDLNFIFVPTENIVFPPQEFSFDKEKMSAKNVGTIIFVQNKGVPWNAYVGTTDFVSLSGKGTIPASAITIIPGEYKILKKDNGSVIRTGDRKKFKNKSEKNALVTVNPTNDTEQIFSMDPTIQVSIPPGTLPGHYRGTLTITSL